MRQQTVKHKLNYRTSHTKLNKFLHKKHTGNSLQSSNKKKHQCIQQSLYKDMLLSLPGLVPVYRQWSVVT